MFFNITLYGYKFNGKRWIKVSQTMNSYADGWIEMREKMRTSILFDFPSYREGYAIQLIGEKK